MRKIILSAIVALMGLPALVNAQLPNMDVSHGKLWFEPLDLRIGMGTYSIPDLNTRLKVANGKVQIAGKAGYNQYLEFLTPGGPNSQFRQWTEGNAARFDWSLQPAVGQEEAWFSLFRHTDFNGAKGLRLYGGNGMDEVQAQLGVGGSNSFLHLDNSRLGIGTASPEEKLHLSGGAFRISSKEDPNTYLQLETEAYDRTILYSPNAPLWLQSDKIHFGNEYTALVSVDVVEGKVSIGTDLSNVPDGYRLGIDGKVICEELKVQSSEAWPDYVFEESYPRMSLSETADFINSEKHLPGIPSAAEITEQGGMEVGVMQRLLLEKVEELTLHLIDLKKENEALRARLEQLEKQ